MEVSEPGCLPVVEFRKCHFYSLLILDDARPIILAVITKQNVNSLLERERETWEGRWMYGRVREQGGRTEERRKPSTETCNIHNFSLKIPTSHSRKIHPGQSLVF